MFSQVSNTPHNRDTNKKLVKIIHSLLQNEQSSAFRKPVPHKALGLGDYKKIVKKPIDLNQIRRQNNEYKYKTIEQALDDIELCWYNCKIYNHASSEVYHQAISLQQLFWRMVQENFPEIYTAAEARIREIQVNQPNLPLQESKGDKNYDMSQSDMPNKEDRFDPIDDSEMKNEEQDAQESKNDKAEEELNESANPDNNDNRSQKSEFKQATKEPIEVCLKERPSAESINHLTTHMKSIEDKGTLEQVLEVLFTHEKQNLSVSPKGQMHFRMHNIHLSTYHRICKIVKLEVEDLMDIIE